MSRLTWPARATTGLAVLAGVLLLFYSGPVAPALAHANLVRSIPAAGAVLVQSPPQMTLEFSEDLDPGFTKVDLLDASGQVVAPGPGVIEAGQPRVLRLSIGLLSPGTYSAVWRARSAVDGHVTEGSIGFSVGKSSPPASLLPPPGTPDPATVWPTAADTVARWLNYLTAALTVGALAFGPLVWRRAYRSQAAPAPESDAAATRMLKRLLLVGLVGLWAATLGFAAVQAAQASGAAIGEAGGAPFLRFWLGRTGSLLLARLGLLVVLGWQVPRLPLAGAGRVAPWGAALLLGSGTLLTFSLQSHSAAAGSLLGVALDWLHLAATAAWLGGLPPLLLALRQDGLPASALVPRFSIVALTSVATLAVTGLYSALEQVRTWEALAATTFGQALIAKTGLFGLLVALGAVNLLGLSPRLQRPGSAVRWLGRTMRSEMGLGLGLLLAVGVMTGVAPAFSALEARQQQGFIRSASLGAVKLLLRVAPGSVGDNEFGVEFTDARPGAVRVPPTVLLRFTMTSMNMGTQQVEATSPDGRRYMARGSYVSMSGPWRVEVILRRAGFDDVRQVFDLDVHERAPP